MCEKRTTLLKLWPRLGWCWVYEELPSGEAGDVVRSERPRHHDGSDIWRGRERENAFHKEQIQLENVFF